MVGYRFTVQPLSARIGSVEQLVRSIGTHPSKDTNSNGHPPGSPAIAATAYTTSTGKSISNFNEVRHEVTAWSDICGSSQPHPEPGLANIRRAAFPSRHRAASWRSSPAPVFWRHFPSAILKLPWRVSKDRLEFLTSKGVEQLVRSIGHHSPFLYSDFLIAKTSNGHPPAPPPSIRGRSCPSACANGRMGSDQ